MKKNYLNAIFIEVFQFINNKLKSKPQQKHNFNSMFKNLILTLLSLLIISCASGDNNQMAESIINNTENKIILLEIPNELSYLSDDEEYGNFEIPVPVILFQSGYGSSSESHAPLLQAISNAGYVVVVPDRKDDKKGGKESDGE